MTATANYDESKAGGALLPSPLQLPDGGRVTAATNWNNVRRREILADFASLMYGELPPLPQEVRFELRREIDGALENRAIRREVRIHLGNAGKRHFIDVLWYLPREHEGKVPAIVGLNFKGNCACTTEGDVFPSAHTAAGAGEQAGRWCLETLLSEGFSVATACYHDLYPDHADGRKDSVWQLFHPTEELSPSKCDLTAISAWSFGISRLVDLLLTDPAIDGNNIWTHGHSRLGKTSLWAAANDLRIAGVISNDSGCCGAAPSRRNIGETLASITQTFPWWFVSGFDRFAGCEEELPFDQNFLLALIAPRPLLVASATEDIWADPRGEFLCARAASEVYKLFGSNGIKGADFPAPDQPVFGDAVGYYLRTGQHDVTPADWKFVLEFIRKNTTY